MFLSLLTLREAFSEICIHHYKINNGADIWGIIIEKYAQSHRYYHNVSHLEILYSGLKTFAESNILNTEQEAILISAIVYHDIIYNVPSLQAQNEIDSAAFWMNHVKSYNFDVSEYFINTVQEIILATALHTQLLEEISDSDKKQLIELFLDLDTAILGSSEPEYKQYVANIGLEYQVFGTELIMLGRKKFVSDMLAKPKIYYNPYFQSHFGSNAIQNLQNELQHLE